MNQDLWLCDVASGEARLLTPHTGNVVNAPAPWRPDGSGFYMLTDRDREFVGLAVCAVEFGQAEWIATPDWDVEQVAVSPDGRYLAYVVNEDGWSRLYVRDVPDGDERDFPRLPRGVYSNLHFSPTETLLALMIAQPSRPNSIYLLNVESSELRRLTQSYFGGVPESEMVIPELVRYPTHDGREIPAFLYKPQGDAGAFASGRPLDPRRTGSAGAAALHVLRPLPIPAQPRDRRPGAERARLHRLRQDATSS